DDVTSDEMISPSEVPIDDTADLQRYPRAFVERPLVLPHGIVELWAAARTARETFRDNWVEYGGASVGVTVGRGAYELGTGTDFLVFETDNLSEEAGEPPTFQRWHASAVVQVAPQTSLGVQGVVGVPMSRFRRYSPSLDVAHKFRPSPRGAIVVHGGVDYNYGRAGSNAQVVTHLLGAYAGAAVSVQVTPLVALRLGGRVAQYKYVDRFYGATKSFGWVSAGATILISISERADLSLFLGRSSGPVDTTSGGLTFTIRSSR
ncbi:MAG TPA: hypothetical protein VK427_07995, partial [Kofleriaceae bacterium]|nr:hypothetical protein [Kofleriaceae bacterium]